MSKQKGAKYPGVWKSFFHMLHASHLPYLGLALALVTGLASSTLSLRFPDYVNELLGGVNRETLIKLFWLGTMIIVLSAASLVIKL